MSPLSADRTGAGPGGRFILYYDGHCPICSRWRDYVEARSTVDLRLRDAREHPDEIAALAERGLDINSGMILVTPGGAVQGAEAIIVLRAYTRRRQVGDLILRALLRAPWLVRLLYPLARAVRHLVLKVLGRETRL